MDESLMISICQFDAGCAPSTKVLHCPKSFHPFCMDGSCFNRSFESDQTGIETLSIIHLLLKRQCYQIGLFLKDLWQQIL